jgi:hypothetical protein
VERERPNDAIANVSETERPARFIRASWISRPRPLKDKTVDLIGAGYIQQGKSTSALANRISPH